MAEGHICAVDGCTNILTKTSGRICQTHRSRYFRHGSYDISPNWTHSKKGKPCIAPTGYVRVNVNGKRVLQHRLIMEQHLGRPLTNTERVHHKNGDKTDNRIENLALHSSHSDHMKNHHRYIWRKRKIRPPYTPEMIADIMHRLSMPSPGAGRTRPKGATCFCGSPVETRNLCHKHFHWAWIHKFI